MSRLTTNFVDKKFKNPIVMASGTFGFGREYNELYDIQKLGGISSKGLTINSKAGNEGLRVWETASGMMNSIGLENPGVKSFAQNELPRISKLDLINIVNVGGNDLEQYKRAIEILNEYAVDIIELNISCPNVKSGGMAFGMRAETAAYITREIKNISKHKLMVKLSPNAENIVEVAKGCEEAGADALSMVNTFQAMAIDIKNKRSVFNNIYAGLSGPAIKPIALRMVHQVSKAVNIPIMGLGGIKTWKDALEFIMVGATCIQVGTTNFIDPFAGLKIIAGLDKYCVSEGLKNISEVRGII